MRKFATGSASYERTALEPATPAEVEDETDQDQRHQPEDDEEPGGVALVGDPGVHPHDAGDQRQRQDHDADRGQHPEDVVEAVGDHRLVGLLQRLGDLLVVLEHVPDPLVGVDDVVEVDLEVEVGREVALLDLLEVAQHRSLRPDHLAEVDDLLLDVGDIAYDLLRAPLEDVVLERVELVADLAQHREAVVEAVVDEAVEQVARAAREELFAQLLLGPTALEQVLNRLQGLVGDRHHIAGPDEEVELARAQSPGGGIEDREVKDDEEVVVIDVDLRPLVAREHVLEVEGVEVEVLLQPGSLQCARTLDVDPAQAGGVDLLDARCLRLSLSCRGDELVAPADASQPRLRKVRHRSRSSSRRAWATRLAVDSHQGATRFPLVWFVLT